MPAPIVPISANNWLSTPDAGQALQTFPANLVSALSEDAQKKILRFMQDKYLFPQIMERQPFEQLWDKLLLMYRIKLDKVDTSIDENSRVGQSQKEDVSDSGESVRLADSLMYDAVERLTDVHHFISFKEGLPIQYNIPHYYDTRKEDSFYHPLRDKIKAANCFLAWNADNEQIYLKHLITARHFYQYGIAFARSEFAFEVQMVPRMSAKGMVQIPQIAKIGTTFDPISIRKLWLNWRLMANEMDYQPCPFFYEETPRFATLQNQYDPRLNPHGFGNLDKVAASNPGYLFGSQEMDSARKALESIAQLDNKPVSIPQILEPKYSVEALWTFYPMLPLDPNTGEWETRQNGQPVPMQRFIVNSWGTNLVGQQILLRIQRNFYPRDSIPLYGTSHMPDLDSGLYSPSMGYLLWNHYREIVTCKNQYIENKDWINDPPTMILQSSPAQDQPINRKGQKITVNSMNDLERREAVDGTQTTVSMMRELREQAQTSSKSQDAILGKALGGRTSATEAQNVFQASMSAITTPINIFNYDIMGGYADRVWEYTATWFPPTLLKEITGQMGFAISPEDLWIKVGLKWDIGSTYIESIVRQQNLRYVLESSMGDPSINRAPLWQELLTEWRFDNVAEIVNDQGFAKEVYIATNQAIDTFVGDNNVLINPDQNHAIAIKVKIAFLEDSEGVWAKKYPERLPLLAQQITMHQ